MTANDRIAAFDCLSNITGTTQLNMFLEHQAQQLAAVNFNW
jgi:hypothetical protein